MLTVVLVKSPYMEECDSTQTQLQMCLGTDHLEILDWSYCRRGKREKC
jgi:hypothetical protein